ncbi:MAG: lipoprotein [Oleibacter sp.]|nr:lipoprotein [Thalassolituus sp.]
MKKLIYIFALSLAFILSGCSGKPSDGEIEKQITGNLLSDGGDEIFIVENFKKTNGFEKDSKTYIADVKYELVFKKGLQELAQLLEKESQSSPFGAMGASLGMMALQMQYGNFKAGHRVEKEEKVTFIKTENGWRINTE